MRYLLLSHAAYSEHAQLVRSSAPSSLRTDSATVRRRSSLCSPLMLRASDALAKRQRHDEDVPSDSTPVFHQFGGAMADPLPPPAWDQVLEELEAADVSSLVARANERAEAGDLPAAAALFRQAAAKRPQADVYEPLSQPVPAGARRIC